MTDTPATPRRRGAARTEGLLQVTLDLAAEVGYAGLSIEAVARRPGSESTRSTGAGRPWRRCCSTRSAVCGLDYRDTGEVRATRAQRTGELVAEANLEFAAEVLCGTLYYRSLLSTRPIDEDAVDGLLDMFMAAYGEQSRQLER
ncbi:TetR-like C-terminal domain-containing protein [Streptomyces inhibens]|uniref:TetR-like C-terminal domain-containing protein n=1 Tax=Streptomyces inhibens TaxID=2293571 RepID=UPI00402ADB43